MEILERLHMPPFDPTRVPVKTLEEQLCATNREKKLLESHIASMYLISLLNEQTVRIRAYKDDEYSFQAIYVFQIQLKTDDQMTDFTELIHSVFPESSLLILNYKEKIYISGASKRINRSDSTKSVVEDTVWAVLPDNHDIEVTNVANLKEYNEKLNDVIYRIKVLNVTGIYPTEKRDYKVSIKEYEYLTAQINKLKEEYITATMQNEKMRIDEKLYKKECELSELKESLGGGK